MNDLKFTNLKELTSKIGSGATPSGGQSSYKAEGISLIRSQNVLDMSFSTSGLALIDEEQAAKLDGVSVQENDILLNITGDSIARVCKVPKEILPARVNQHVSIIRTNSKIDPDYLLYYLISRKEHLLTISRVGGTRNALTKEAIEKLAIRIDDKDAEIATVLSALDKKVELNNKINAELEQMAKTLYDYWFVQFDFPISREQAAVMGKPELEGKPYKSSGGKMVWNEVLKREIPEGWESTKLETIEPEIITGKTPSTQISEYFGGDIPFITIDDIRSQLFISRAARMLTNTGAQSQFTKYVNPGDICVSCIGTIGEIGIVGRRSQTNQQINTIAVKRSFNRYFLLNALNRYFSCNVAAKKGAVLSNMNKSEFSSIPILDANIEIKTSFNKIVGPIYKKIEMNLKQNQELSLLRDWLLPMLMNGQVTVK